MADTKLDDSMPDSWVKRLPEGWRPYLRLARLDRPIGAWLLLWPCWWGLALEALAHRRVFPNPWLLLLFLAGAFVMRAAGCTYNDILDRDFDAQVARTRERPIASGQIGVGRAVLFLAGLLLGGLLILTAFNALTIWLALAALPLVALYPFAKRFTDWPQFVLGLAFNWGALLGWTAAAGSLALAPLLLYGAGIAWTLGYDTIYAHQDKADDARIGVRSSALALGARTGVWLNGFYLSALALLVLAAMAAGGGVVGMLITAAAGAHLAWQLRVLDTNDPASCLRVFRANHGFGALVFAALLLANWLG